MKKTESEVGRERPLWTHQAIEEIGRVRYAVLSSIQQAFEAHLTDAPPGAIQEKIAEAADNFVNRTQIVNGFSSVGVRVPEGYQNPITFFLDLEYVTTEGCYKGYLVTLTLNKLDSIYAYRSPQIALQSAFAALAAIDRTPRLDGSVAIAYGTCKRYPYPGVNFDTKSFQSEKAVEVPVS